MLDLEKETPLAIKAEPRARPKRMEKKRGRRRRPAGPLEDAGEQMSQPQPRGEGGRVGAQAGPREGKPNKDGERNPRSA